MPKIKSDVDLESMVQGSIVSMEILLLHEIRDCDLTIGTPFYENKVKNLKKTVESYPRIKDDKEYWKELEKIQITIPNQKDIRYNMRQPDHKQKEVGKIKQIDYEALDKILRNYLAKYGMTFRIENKDRI